MDLDFRAAYRAAIDAIYEDHPDLPAYEAGLVIPVPGVRNASVEAGFNFGPTGLPDRSLINLCAKFQWLGSMQRMPWPGPLGRDLPEAMRDEIAAAFSGFLAERVLATFVHFGQILAYGGASPEEAGEALAAAVLAAPAADVHGR